MNHDMNMPDRLPSGPHGQPPQAGQRRLAPVPMDADDYGDEYDDFSDLDAGAGDRSLRGRPDDDADGEVVYLDDPDSLLEEAINLVAEARALPMSTTVKVNRDELLELLEAARDFLPTELAAARQLMTDRDHFLDQAHEEAENILAQAREQAGRMIERTEIVHAAQDRARQIVEQAQTEATELRSQVDDYCDRKLASFENVLDRTARTVSEGRSKLAGGDFTG